MVAHYWHSPANSLHWIQWSVLALRCQVLWRRRSAEARAPAIKCSAVAIWSLLLMLSNDIKRLQCLQLCKKKELVTCRNVVSRPPTCATACRHARNARAAVRRTASSHKSVSAAPSIPSFSVAQTWQNSWPIWLQTGFNEILGAINP